MPKYYPRHSQGEQYRIITACDNKVWLTLPTEAANVQGLAMPPMEHRTARAPYQSGETWMGTVLRPRPIEVAVFLRARCRPDLWALRQFLMQAMNPLMGPFYFQICFDSGEIYTLRQVVFDTGFDDRGRRDAHREVVAFRLMAYDPVWYGASDGETALDLDTVTSLVLPAAFPITFGVERRLDETIVCTNAGNWISYPTISIYGGIQHPVIENFTTQEQIRLNYNLVDGETVVIDLTPGAKTVSNSLGDNLLGYISDDSDLATFHLDPAPFAEGGQNSINCFGGAPVGSSPRVRITWYNRYLGV